MSKKEASNKATHLIELDDLNLDSAWLTKSKICPQQLRVGTDPSAAIEHLIYDSGFENFVLDVGGNETASKTLAAIGEQNFFRHFDLIVIPVRDEGQDVENAVKTLQIIRAHDKEVRVAILLNDITSREQNLADLALREEFAEVFDLADAAAAELIVMPRIARYGRSRQLGMTQWEIANAGNLLLEEIHNAVLAHENAGRSLEAKVTSRLTRVVNSSMKESKKFIDNAHARLDEILGERPRLRLMSVSTKGGVGKSVCSQQLLATYLLAREALALGQLRELSHTQVALAVLLAFSSLGLSSSNLLCLLLIQQHLVDRARRSAEENQHNSHTGQNRAGRALAGLHWLDRSLAQTEHVTTDFEYVSHGQASFAKLNTGVSLIRSRRSTPARLTTASAVNFCAVRLRTSVAVRFS